jgi:hypothetical protein
MLVKGPAGVGARRGALCTACTAAAAALPLRTYVHAHTRVRTLSPEQKGGMLWRADVQRSQMLCVACSVTQLVACRIMRPCRAHTCPMPPGSSTGLCLCRSQD